MATPQSQPETRTELQLPALINISLASDPCSRCSLSPQQAAGLEKLSELWARIAGQLAPLVERNAPILRELAEPCRLATLSSHGPFLADWAALATGSQHLMQLRSPDAHEIRALLNALHETALLASLLGSYGTGPFISAAGPKIQAAQDPSTALPPYAVRLYRHKLVRDALDSQLLGVPQIDSPIENIALLAAHAPLHSKEQLLIDAGLALAVAADQHAKILVATGPDHAAYLGKRLSGALAGAAPGCVRTVGRGLADTSLISPSDRARVLVASIHAIGSIDPADISRVIVYSPVIIEGLKMSVVSREVCEQIRSRFPDALHQALRIASPHFDLDYALHDRSIPPEPVSGLPEPVSGSKAAVPAQAKSGRPHQPVPPAPAHRPSSIQITLPHAAQTQLFSEADIAALAPPAPPTAAVRPLAKVDLATLPRTSEELNARLGISLIKPALIPRPDQLQRLFEMLEQPSFTWLIKASTGFGKTALASVIMGIRLGNSPLTPAECRRGFRIAYVTPNVDLCAQAKREFLRFLDVADAEIGILHGKVPLRRRADILQDPSSKIIVSTPETLLKTVAAAEPHLGFDSFALMVVDEFQSAEGEHAMARLVRQAAAAGIPILPQSGTPARDAEDLAEKRALAPLQGALVPETLQPLKNHDLVNSHLQPHLVRLADELATFSYGPYVQSREQLANARSLIRQLTGAETPMLFQADIVIKRRPHIESFDHPSSRTFKKLKADALELRTTLRRLDAEARSRGERLNETGQEARTRLNLASVNIARMSSITSRTSLLTTAGTYPFLHDFASTWIKRYLENGRREGAFPAFQDFFRKPEFRGIVRIVAEGTPFIHLLQSSTTKEALQRAFGLPDSLIPDAAPQRHALFLQLAVEEMAKRPAPDHPKEAKLFERIEELRHRGQAHGIIVFAEPRHLTKYLALRLQHRFGPLGIRTGFVTGEGDGFADRLLTRLHAQRSGYRKIRSADLGTWDEIREAFQRKPGQPGERVDIIVATSRLSVGHNLSAAAEAHIYTMHADAQKLIQQIGRVGRPDGDNFFGRVGQCFYHVTRNTPEWYLFLSAIRKYTWIRDTLTKSEAWELPPPATPGGSGPVA
jgi:ERCC4-related helicase